MLNVTVVFLWWHAILNGFWVCCVCADSFSLCLSLTSFHPIKIMSHSWTSWNIFLWSQTIRSVFSKGNKQQQTFHIKKGRKMVALSSKVSRCISHLCVWALVEMWKILKMKWKKSKYYKMWIFLCIFSKTSVVICIVCFDLPSDYIKKKLKNYRWFLLMIFWQ